MPSSKRKNHSKASPPEPSPVSSCCAPSTPGRAPELEDQHLLPRILASAAAKFPAFISEAAFCGWVSETGSSASDGGHLAKIWLPQAAMLSAAIAPRSVVSLSLAAADKNWLEDHPLERLDEECARHFGVDVGDTTANGVGCFFALATVYPSREVSKNRVRLSWGLSCTMGFPAMGRIVFVFPIGGASSNSQVALCKSKDLYLSLVPPKIRGINCRDQSSLLSTLMDKPASPKTPLSHSKSSNSPCTTPLQLRKSFGVAPHVDSSSCMDLSAIRSTLADEKERELHQKVAGQWLDGRHLLNHNFVTVPIASRLCIFRVEGGCDLQMRSASQDSICERKCNSLPCENQNSGLQDYGNAISLLLDVKTRVHLFDSMASLGESPKITCLPQPSVPNKAGGESEAGHIPRLGGLSKEVAVLNEIIMFSLGNKDSLPRYKGVLLYGPPGTGKTSLATYCARGAGVSLFSINGPEIISQYYGESEQALHDIFESARQAAPSVVFIDELDAIAPARKDGGEELSLRIVATLLKLMDEITRVDKILVLAATNRPDSIDPALRRPGRLDREIEIGVPSPGQRFDILVAILHEVDHSLSDTEIQSLAMATHGFVAADLAALCNEAAMIALRRYIKFQGSGKHVEKPPTKSDGIAANVQGSDRQKDQGGFSAEHVDCLSLLLSELTVTQTSLHGNCQKKDVLLKVNSIDFEMAKMKVRPSAMREVMLEFPKVHWEDVGGQTEIKKQLIEAVQWPQVCPDAFQRLGIRPPRGLLMIGPPGCSKTLMARAVASEAQLNFLAVKGPELFSKWVGESEKAVKSLFAKARANAPAIIFFDEIDGLAITRGLDSEGISVADRVLSQLLVEMDGLDQRVGVTVIAATNRPDKIDHALLRPGRFDRLLDVQPPNETDREDIFRVHTRYMPCSSDVTLKELAHLTEGYTGADIKLACREAALAALEESLEISAVSMAHFEIGIRRVQPSNVQFYQELAGQFRRLVDTGSVRND